MNGARRIACGIVLAMTVSLGASGQIAKKDSAREKLIGAWHLVHIDSPGPDGNSASGPQPQAC